MQGWRGRGGGNFSAGPTALAMWRTAEKGGTGLEVDAVEAAERSDIDIIWLCPGNEWRSHVRSSMVVCRRLKFRGAFT